MNGLEPVRAWRLERANAMAARTIAAARDEAARRRAAAESQAAELVAAAEHQGEAAADADTVRDWTAARRQARGIVLAAQRTAYRELVEQAAAAVSSDPRANSLTARIADRARRELGPGAEVEVRDGVMLAIRRGRGIRWSAADAVEQVMNRGSVDVEALWR